MSEDAKNLLLRLKKEKKINKQIELIQKLRDYNQEDIVNSVLLKHLESKDHDTLRLEILSALNYDDEQIIFVGVVDCIFKNGSVANASGHLFLIMSNYLIAVLFSKVFAGFVLDGERVLLLLSVCRDACVD